MKPKHSRGMAAWGTDQTAIASLFLPAQHPSSAVPLSKEVQDYLVSRWVTRHVGTDLIQAPGYIGPRAVGPIQPLPSTPAWW